MAHTQKMPRIHELGTFKADGLALPKESLGNPLQDRDAEQVCGWTAGYSYGNPKYKITNLFAFLIG